MRVLFVTLAVVIVDQITKLLVHGFSIPFLGISVKGFEYGQSVDVIGKFLQLTFVENPGIAFGIDIGVGQKFFLTLFTLVLSIAIFLYLYMNKNEKLIYRIAIALILGGAIGNLIDRMFYGVLFNYDTLFQGKVVDFISVEFPDFTLFGKTYTRFPIFNIADSAVTIGVVLLLFFSPSNNKKSSEPEEENEIPAEEKQSENIPENKEEVGNSEITD